MIIIRQSCSLDPTSISKLWILNYKMHNWKAFYCMNYHVVSLSNYYCWHTVTFKVLFIKTSISGASFLHELIQFAYSECVCKKSFATIITFEWLISFMNWFNMLISRVLFGKACMLHKCYICMTFFLPWAICPFSCPFFRDNAWQILQLNYESWILNNSISK